MQAGPGYSGHRAGPGQSGYSGQDLRRSGYSGQAPASVLAVQAGPGITFGRPGRPVENTEIWEGGGRYPSID